MPPILHHLPTPVLEQIALEVTAHNPLGPPHDLLPLLLTSRTLYHALCFARNPHFYAALFRTRFDHRAARRRLGQRATFASNVAHQLKQNCIALARIRRGDIAALSVEDDLWAAYFMMIENDGLNAAQLAWAGLKEFALHFVQTRLHDGADRGLPREDAANTLVLWLIWFTSDADEVAAEIRDARYDLMDLIRPYVALPVRYAPFYQPDNHLDFPIPEGRPMPYSRTAHGAYPVYRLPMSFATRHLRYNIPIDIALPPISIAAKLIYFSRAEVDYYPIPQFLPPDRGAALAQGINHVVPTQEDYVVFNDRKGARMLPKNDIDWWRKLSEAERTLEDDSIWRPSLKSPSAKWENDWNRGCFSWDPWASPTQRHVLYTPGLIVGDWMGRMLVSCSVTIDFHHSSSLRQLPDPDQYWSVVMSDDNDYIKSKRPSMSTIPISFRLREHHCIDPRVPVPTGGSSEDDYDDGINNAWLPANTTVHPTASTVVLKGPRGDTIEEYETYVEGKKSSHDEDTCTMCAQRREQSERAIARRMEQAKRMESSKKRRGSDSLERFDNLASGGDGRPTGKRARRPLRLDPNEGNWTAPEAAFTALGGWALSQQNEREDAEFEEACAVVQRLMEPAAGSLDELLEDEMRAGDAPSAFDYNTSGSCTGVRDIIVTGEVRSPLRVISADD